MERLRLETASLFLDGQGSVAVVPNGPNFYARIKNDSSLGGTMITMGTRRGASGSGWEKHPAVEEILVILEGTRRVVFEHEDGRTESVTATAGEAVIVPRGVWHRTQGTEGSRVLFITYGAGTTHKPLDPEDRR